MHPASACAALNMSKLRLARLLYNMHSAGGIECWMRACPPAQVTSGAAVSALWTLANPLFLVAACVATPLCMVLFGACLAAGSVAFKWALVGKVAPGVHRCRGPTGPFQLFN